MKRKTLHLTYTVLLAFTLLFYAGCSVGSDTTDDDYKTGTGSLDISFDSNSPPRQLLQEQKTAVILRLQNEGAYEIDTGYVTLNYDKSIISSETYPLFEAFSLEGKSVAWPKGESTVVTFKVESNRLPQESQVQETQFIATACYNYRTEVFVDVCMESDPYDLKPDEAEEVCSGSDYSPGSSGGPVNVKSVNVMYDVEGSQILPTLSIELGKTSGAFIFKQGLQADYCTSSSYDSTSSKDVVGIQVYLSDRPLICNTNEIKLIDGRATVSCDGYYLDASVKNYVAPLTVLLDYGIMTSTSKNVEVVRTS